MWAGGKYVTASLLLTPFLVGFLVPGRESYELITPSIFTLFSLLADHLASYFIVNKILFHSSFSHYKIYLSASESAPFQQQRQPLHTVFWSSHPPIFLHTLTKYYPLQSFTHFIPGVLLFSLSRRHTKVILSDCCTLGYLGLKLASLRQCQEPFLVFIQFLAQIASHQRALCRLHDEKQELSK